MKQFLLRTIACCAVLLPFSQAEAKTFGGFKVGKTFTFTVEKVISVKKAGVAGADTKAKIPSSVPKYKKGEKVKFTIGKGGKLTAKDGLSIPFKDDGGTSNVYNFVKTGLNSTVNNALVHKSTGDKPTGVSLTFIRNTYAGFDTTINTVTYTLK